MVCVIYAYYRNDSIDLLFIRQYGTFPKRKKDWHLWAQPARVLIHNKHS